ncbi:MAG: ABC transporter permease [Planctomycetota bacterium]
MRETRIVLVRELRGYFNSPIAYVFGALFLFVILARSVAAIGQGQPADMGMFFSGLPLLYLLFLPVLSMRLWAEERKLGTLELLMTFPVKIRQLVLGKFLAALLFLCLVMLLSVGLPLTLDATGKLDWGVTIGGYVAAMLVAASYLAVGMFFSSLTRDQIVAALLSIVVLGVLYMLGVPEISLLLSRIGLPDWAVELLGALSPARYFSSITRGVVDTRDAIYFGSFCALFLYFNGLVLAGRRMRG